MDVHNVPISGNNTTFFNRSAGNVSREVRFQGEGGLSVVQRSPLYVKPALSSLRRRIIRDVRVHSLLQPNARLPRPINPNRGTSLVRQSYPYQSHVSATMVNSAHPLLL